MSLDSFDDLAERAEYPPPAIYTEVLRARHVLQRENPGGVSTVDMGIAAWNALDDQQRKEALVIMLGHYVQTVYDQEHQEKLHHDAADPNTTYLDCDDVGVLWESIQCAEVDPVDASRWALIHVLSELELLQHRLAMREQEIASIAAQAA